MIGFNEIPFGGVAESVVPSVMRTQGLFLTSATAQPAGVNLFHEVI